MTTYALTDTVTMLRRNLLHMRRYPSMVGFVIGIPVILLLLFVYVFGGTLGNGLPGVSGGRGAYTNYIAPGILLFTVVGAAQMTAISVAMDMTEGIIARFKTMAIWRPSVLAGHVFGALVQSMTAVVAVFAVALAIGFGPNATPLEWLAALGLVALTALALTWLTVALGLVSKSVETASNLPMFLMLLPFLGSGFVPTDSMPAGLRWFADNQPFTPINETLRHLLTGGHVGSNAIAAVAWCAAIARRRLPLGEAAVQPAPGPRLVGGAVLLVGDVAAPIHSPPTARLVDLLHGDVGHEAVGSGAMPVVLARLEEDAVAGADRLDRSALALTLADALGDEDRLAVGVGVPGGPGPGREVDERSGESRAARRCGDGVDVDVAREPVRRTLLCVDAAVGDLHASVSSNGHGCPMSLMVVPTA